MIYKEINTDDAKLFGPFTSEQMLDMSEKGEFKEAGVWSYENMNSPISIEVQKINNSLKAVLDMLSNQQQSIQSIFKDLTEVKQNMRTMNNEISLMKREISGIKQDAKINAKINEMNCLSEITYTLSNLKKKHFLFVKFNI